MQALCEPRILDSAYIQLLCDFISIENGGNPDL
jgi:hypothetical protein